MKRITGIALLLFPIAIFAQCGIYKTLQDFKNNKLSQTCESIMVEKLGSKFIIILHNGDKKEKIELKGSGIWGYKKEMTDYRIIDDVPHAIATKGEIWMYSGAGDKIGLAKDFNNDTTYYKESNALPFASKGLEGALVEVGVRCQIKVDLRTNI